MTTAPSTVQLEFDLEALGLELDPTEAMRRGEQLVFQHSWCGTVVVKPAGAPRATLGACPACEPVRALDPWWQQEIGPSGLAGLRQREAEQGS